MLDTAARLLAANLSADRCLTAALAPAPGGPAPLSSSAGPADASDVSVAAERIAANLRSTPADPAAAAPDASELQLQLQLPAFLRRRLAAACLGSDRTVRMDDLSALLPGEDPGDPELPEFRAWAEGTGTRAALWRRVSYHGLLKAYAAEQEQRRLLARQNDELRGARAEAEAASRAKGDFLSVVTHELRTPMQARACEYSRPGPLRWARIVLIYLDGEAAVLGISRLLLDTGLTRQQEDFVRIVLQSGNALVDLIGEILDCGKIERGTLELEEAPFSARCVVESVLDLLAPSAAIKARPAPPPPRGDKGLGWSYRAEA
eukprot:tig00000042_g15435.t1